MALPSVASLTTDLEALTPSDNSLTAMTAFANVIGDFMDQVQAGSLGTSGIFTFDRSTFATELAALPTVADTSWISGVSDAWETAVLSSTITPGTVSDPTTWTASTVDINTLSSPSSTILNISSAKSTLSAGLASATFDNSPPEPIAQAFSDATLTFNFNTIGLALPSTPVPVVRGAQ